MEVALKLATHSLSLQAARAECLAMLGRSQEASEAAAAHHKVIDNTDIDASGVAPVADDETVNVALGLVVESPPKGRAHGCL